MVLRTALFSYALHKISPKFTERSGATFYAFDGSSLSNVGYPTSCCGSKPQRSSRHETPGVAGTAICIRRRIACADDHAVLWRTNDPHFSGKLPTPRRYCTLVWSSLWIGVIIFTVSAVQRTHPSSRWSSRACVTRDPTHRASDRYGGDSLGSLGPSKNRDLCSLGTDLLCHASRAMSSALSRRIHASGLELW